MLLCGSFQNQVIRLINMLRFDEKQLSYLKGSETGKTEDSNPDSLVAYDGEDDENLASDLSAQEDEDTDTIDDVEDLENKSEAISRKDWRRVRKVYERSKQYIFVAATLPANGKATAGGVLKRMFPEASWVSGNYLHCHNPRCPLFLLRLCRAYWILKFLCSYLVRCTCDTYYMMCLRLV